MKHLILLFGLVSFAFSSVAYGGTKVVEGAEAKSLYEANKASSKVLVQKDKTFIYKDETGAETPKPKSITIKAGERLFLTNEEEKYVHNIYDSTDNSWVLKKQKPSEIAVLVFDSPGKHKLRCAIHPKMKIKVVVE